MSENPATEPGPASQPPKRKGFFGCFAVLSVLGIGAILVALMLPAVSRSRIVFRRTRCRNNLKQIALALHNYEAAYHALPPACTVDADGKPLHSWRTLILPYLDQQQLYETIDLSKPWDDPANSEAFNTPVPVYLCPTGRHSINHTTYLASVASNGCFRLAESRHLSEITDGLSKTLMVIEVPSEFSVPWMAPDDADEELVMSIDSDSTPAHIGGMNAALCDGTVRFLSSTLSAVTRRALISIAAGDEVGEF
jgi:Protein of unknown function (DUF1559)